MDRRPSVGVVVPTYNAPEALRATLASLACQTDPPDEVLVADDGSGDPTRAVVEEFASRLPLAHVWQPDNGFRLAAIRNRAIARSACDYLVLLDGDTVAHRRFVEDHRRYAHPRRAVAGGRCGIGGFHGKAMDAPGPISLLFLHLQGRVHNDTDRIPQGFAMRSRGLCKGIRSPWAQYRPFGERSRTRVAGGNLAFWKHDAEGINGFDEAFVGWGGEDHDFCDRMVRSGCALWQLLGRAVCFHINHPTAPVSKINRAIRLDARPIRCASGLDRHALPAIDRDHPRRAGSPKPGETRRTERRARRDRLP